MFKLTHSVHNEVILDITNVRNTSQIIYDGFREAPLQSNLFHFHAAWEILDLPLKLLDIHRNVFTPVCYSVHKGCLAPSARHQTPPSRHSLRRHLPGKTPPAEISQQTPPEQTQLPRQTPPGRRPPPLVKCPSPWPDTPWADPPVRHPLGRHPLGRHYAPPTFNQTATAADGTHPTGMHCCFESVTCNNWKMSLDQSEKKVNSLVTSKTSGILDINCITGWERLIRSHSSARFCFELSGNSN